MCEPAENAGNDLPSLWMSSKVQMSTASLDFRVTRTFKFGRARVQGQLDVYNVFNANTVLTENVAYGAAWLRPTQILSGRFVKFGGQIDF